MKKLSIVLLLLALVLAVVPAAFAQDDTFGASQEDFDAWTAANEALASATSFSYDFTLSLEVSELNVSADLSGSGVIINDEENPGFQLDVTGKVVEGEETTPVNLNVRLVDGNVYYNDGTGWQGSTLGDASSAFLGGFAEGSGLPVDPEALSGDLSGMGDMSGMMEGLEDLNPSDFLSLTHTGDTYTLSLDIGALLSSPALAGLISGALAPAGPDAQEMTAAQQQQMVQMVAMLFSEATITFTETVDSASSLISNAVLDINIPLDNIMGPGAGITLNFDANFSDYNESFTIEVPQGVVVKEASS